MAEKTKAVVYKTPVGIAQYPRLTKPDTKFNPAGEFKISLILDAAVAQPIIDECEKIAAKKLADVKAENPKLVKQKLIKMCEDKPYKPVLDDEGNPTDKVKVNFKMKAVIESKKTGQKWNQRPDLFDSKGTVLVNPNVGGGSEVRVAYEITPFWTQKIGAGVTLRLKAVQIIKLVEYTGGRDAAGYGFEAEDGYEASSETPTEEQADAAATGDEAPNRAADDSEEF
jgi:hypothetical protein